MDWLPIETAPREEWADILVWIDTLDIPAEGGDFQIEGGIMVVQWDGNGWRPSLSDIPEGSVLIPSHWMPIEPPVGGRPKAPSEITPKHDFA